jgi:cytoskeleton protein RodZ
MVHSKIIHPEPQSLSPNETAGKILSSARIGWDLTVEEVADSLNLGVDTIKALEKDDYTGLPGYTFVKGYIRSYANILRLDPEEVIGKVDLKPEKLTEIPAVPGSIKLKGRRPGKKKKKRRIFLKLFLFLLLIIALGFLGLTQWSKLDTQELAELFKLPAGEKSVEKVEEKSSVEIVIPSPVGQSSESDQPKGALIRIE